MSDVLISPSLLSADPLNLAAEIADIEQAGANWHHIDVMDGHFVPNLSFGLPVIRAVKKISTIPLDVHIMISNPDQMALSYVEAGADILTFHVEAACHPHRLIQDIKSTGAMAGIALNPGTSVRNIEPLLPLADLVLMMSVNPGFSGQEFIFYTLTKVRELRHLIATVCKGQEHQPLIQIDGGITLETAGMVIGAGADCLVSGNTVFLSDDRRKVVSLLRQAQPGKS